MASLSDSLLFAAVVVYALAMLGFAGASASRRAGEVTGLAARERVLVGAGGPSVTVPDPVVPRPATGWAGPAAMALTVAGWALHLGSVVTRGLAAGRVPWGNMYEFSSVAALVAVTGFLVLVLRGKVDRSLGAFVMLPVVLYLGLAGTVLYTAVGPLVPALNSYWIKIHVAAAVTASGAFLLSGVLALLYLLRNRYDERTDVGRPVRFPVSLGRALPVSRALDRATYVVIAFAFPVWTFAIIAGGIWAEAAWGRYWGWDPKETWSFITWVLYAGYLHARATAGWKGRKAAWVAVAAAVALIVDYYVVNIFVVGLHSYA
ncbi:MAG: c-type cytochrome biogenesis protein CcsB [Mycobacteriales bacterium]